MATWGLDIITVATTFSHKQLAAGTQNCQHSPELDGLVFRRLEFHLNQRDLETKKKQLKEPISTADVQSITVSQGGVTALGLQRADLS